MNKKIGIIGFGNMGSCIAAKLIASGYEIIVFDKDVTKLINLAKEQIAASNIDLVNAAGVIILAIKPQDFGEVLEEIKEKIADKLIISIAAGITTGYIEKYLGNVRIIRTMPNMPARIGKGITCIYKGKYANEIDLSIAKEIFDNLGKTLVLYNEDLMDAATAISGSGPGFIFAFIENKKLNITNSEEIEFFSKELSKAAESLGFSVDEAMVLAEATISGSIELLKNSKLSVSQLKSQVVSKGGTTEAGLKVMYQGGNLEDIVKAARDRARELSRR